MSETLSLFRSSFNKSLRIESRPERPTGEPGAVLLREIMERTWIIEWLTDRLHDPRKAAQVVVSGRRITMVIGETFAHFWHRLWPRLERLRYADP